MEKEQDNYLLVTEKEMDRQDVGKIQKFSNALSATTNKPIFSFLVHDSDVLWFSISLKGKQVYLFSNEQEYFEGGEIQIKGNDDISVLLGITKDEWEKISNKEKINDYAFVEEYLLEFLKFFDLPTWAVGIGYNYLDDDIEGFDFNEEFKIEKIMDWSTYAAIPSEQSERRYKPRLVGEGRKASVALRPYRVLLRKTRRKLPKAGKEHQEKKRKTFARSFLWNTQNWEGPTSRYQKFVWVVWALATLRQIFMRGR